MIRLRIFDHAVMSEIAARSRAQTTDTSFSNSTNSSSTASAVEFFERRFDLASGIDLRLTFAVITKPAVLRTAGLPISSRPGTGRRSVLYGGTVRPGTSFQIGTFSLQSRFCVVCKMSPRGWTSTDSAAVSTVADGTFSNSKVTTSTDPLRTS